MKAVRKGDILQEKLQFLLKTLFSLLLGYFIGLSIRRNFEVQSVILYSSSQNYNTEFQFFYSRNISQIYVATNPRGAERLPPKIVEAKSDFYLCGCVENEIVKKPNNLLALAVGIRQKEFVNQIVSKFSEDFTIMLFHYDGKVNEWDQFEWSQRAIHISALRQTKWWYAKRFLHPDIVAAYEYIFIWDEDLGVENFNALEYIKLVKKYGLEISQPAVTSDRGLIWGMTKRRLDVEIHRENKGGLQICSNPFLPPCAGFVEIMAPVFSRNSWNCNDLVHGWGLDFAFWRCVETPHEEIGVVDAQWVKHMVLPTLQSESDDGKQARRQVRARSFTEWKEFEKRMEEAEKQHSTKGKISTLHLTERISEWEKKMTAAEKHHL
ncbi:hypothetical protein CDL12_10959 [Handroanthus impetiginosus]|uniref:Uncharacterized protein n=1 Tax=Handroanthus impetiginosus TaxID=429701 RepID=A0A2G9HFU9_9LAMI|nr:hypothetical protein CDL12_10959 [Handroanthus impetiginosus]